MGLLPDEKRSDVGRGIDALRPRHLRPARTLKSVPCRVFERLGQDRVIPGQAALQQMTPIPQRHPRAMRWMHLKMKLTIPTVASKAGFLGRQRSRTLDG